MLCDAGTGEPSKYSNDSDVGLAEKCTLPEPPPLLLELLLELLPPPPPPPQEVSIDARMTSAIPRRRLDLIGLSPSTRAQAQFLFSRRGVSYTGNARAAIASASDRAMSNSQRYWGVFSAGLRGQGRSAFATSMASRASLAHFA